MTDNYLLVDGAGNATEVTGEIKIGRSKTNDLVLKDPLSSRHHATVYFEGEEILVRDEQSVNGTVVNGTKIIAPTALKDQDTIQFGDEVFTVRAPLAESKTVRASDADIAAVEAAAEEDPGATLVVEQNEPEAVQDQSMGEPYPPETKKDNKKTIIIVAGVAVFLCLCCVAGVVIWRYVIPLIAN